MATSTSTSTGTAPRPTITASDEELERIRASYKRKNSTNVTSIIGRVAFWVLVVVVVIYTLFPFYWAIVSSLTPTNDLYVTPVDSGRRA